MNKLEQLPICQLSGIVLFRQCPRTRHNHGTKFRIKHQDIPLVYDSVTQII